MKKMLIFVVCLFVAPAGMISGGYKDLPNAIEKIDKTSVLIRLDDADKTPIGSGVTVVRNGKWYAWTDAHVTAVAKTKDGFNTLKVEKMIVKDDVILSTLSVNGEVIAYDEVLDIALLQLSDGDNKYFTNTKFYLDDKTLPRGTDIILVGNFLNFTTRTPGITGASTGTIGGFGHKCSETGQKFDVIHNGAVTGGCSGSGVYIEDGRCIGLVCRMWTANTVLYSPIREIKKWAAKTDMLWALDEKVKRKP